MENIVAVGAIWLFLSFVVAYIADSKKLGYWNGFLFSFLLSPVIGLILAVVSEDRAVVEQVSPTMINLINEGDYLRKKGQVNEAIEKYLAALPYTYRAPYTNLKLAKIFSLKQDKDNSFKYLVKAVQDGMVNFEFILQDSDLAFLRGTDEFKEYAANGYRTANAPLQAPHQLSRVEELEKLNALYEKGVLTKGEFEVEKQKILAS